MPRQKPQRVMGHARPRAQKDDRNRLVRDLISASREIGSSSGDEAQAAILNLETAALEPDQTMPVGVRNSRLFETETSEQHFVPYLAGRNNSMP